MTHGSVETPPKAGAREWLGLAVIALPCALYAMDLTVLHLAIPQITEQLKPSASGLLWIVDIYGFMVAGLLVTMGTLGDRVGRRRVLMYGAAAFAVTSLMAAFASSAEMLIAARALQGVAGATLAPSTLSLIRNMFLDDRERALAIGVWVASFSGGAALGPVIGGVILEHFWWGAVFLINVPLMLLLLALGPVLLPEYRDPKAGGMDLAGAGLSIVSVLAVIYGIKRIAEDGVAATYLLAIAFGVAVGILFFRREERRTDPLIDVALFRVPGFSAALAVNVLGLFTVLATFLFIAQYFQLVLGMSPLEAGLWTAPSGIVFALGSVIAPFLVRRWQPASVLAVGFAIAAAGYLMLIGLEGAKGPWLTVASMLVICIGIAPVGTITTDIVMAAAPPERAGAASAISETSFEFGGAAGIAVLGSVLTALYRSGLETESLPLDAVAAARDTLGAAVVTARGLPAEEGARLTAAAQLAFVRAFQGTAVIAALASVAAAVLAARFLKRAT